MDVKLVVVKGSKKTREIPLRARETVIGRQVGCGVRIPSTVVSRMHCRITVRDDGVAVEDLGSSNGSLLNGRPLKGTAIARPGDRLEIGPVTFLIEYSSAPKPIQHPEPPVAPPPRVPVLAPAAEVAPIADSAEEFVDAFLLEEEAPARQETLVRPGTTPAEPQPAAPPLAEDEDVPLVLEDEDWQLPAGDELRDILSQMDDKRKQK